MSYLRASGDDRRLLWVVLKLDNFFDNFFKKWFPDPKNTGNTMVWGLGTIFCPSGGARRRLGPSAVGACVRKKKVVLQEKRSRRRRDEHFGRFLCLNFFGNLFWQLFWDFFYALFRLFWDFFFTDVLGCFFFVRTFRLFLDFFLMTF